MPRVASTKSLTGHSQGATGVHEAIYSLLMMDNSFVAASANIENLDHEAEGMPSVRAVDEDVQLNCVMSDGFWFGRTHARLAYIGRETRREDVCQYVSISVGAGCTQQKNKNLY